MRRRDRQSPWTPWLLAGTRSAPLTLLGKLARPAGGGASEQPVSRLPGCEPCDAEHVGTFNPAEWHPEWGKSSVGMHLQGASKF